MPDGRSNRTLYESYLLRLWQEDGSSPWHASLQSTVTQQVQFFAEVEDLCVFLTARLSAAGLQHLIACLPEHAAPADGQPADATSRAGSQPLT